MTGPQVWRSANVLLLFVTLTGCASSRSWSYTPEPRSATEQLANVSVIVLPFEDRRPKENSNYILIYLIPLVPFGWMDFETPEGPQMHVNSGLIGFPSSYTSNGLTLTLKLAKTPASPAIWTHTISGQTSATSWIYALQPDFTYDQLLKAGLRDAITSLAATARTLK